MKWLQQHPNWTIFFMWIIMNALIATAQLLDDIGFWVFYTTAIIGMIATLLWSLIVKHRSLFNIFYLLIPFVGFIIIWTLGSKTVNSIRHEVEDGNRL